MACAICRKNGQKGYFRIPNDFRHYEWCSALDLELNFKAQRRICFRHFKAKDLIFIGTQLRVTKGK